LAIRKFTSLIHRGRPIDLYGDGTARRDFTYIDDIIQGILSSLEYNLELFDVFNLGESDTIEVRQMIAELETVLGRTAIINSLPAAPGDMLATYADVSKARQLLGYTPKTRFQEGLPKFVEWYLRTQSI
jgi:UDP-glucuronate 4-epimerase